MLRVPLDDLCAGERELPREAAHYVAKVHRLERGDRVVAFDPAARSEAEGEVLAVSGARVTVRLEAPRAATRVAVRSVTVIQSVAKGGKLDDVVRDATELGATRVVLALAARSVRRPARGDRWRRIAIEAARQCGRGDAPEVEGPLPLPEALESHAGADRALLLHPEGGLSLAEALSGASGRASVALAIGPEGGFEPDELALAERLGYRRVTLGSFVMRSETACAAVLGGIAALLDGAARS